MPVNLLLVFVCLLSYSSVCYFSVCYEKSQTDEKLNNENKKHSNTNKDRFPLNWNIKNPHWYPEAVREGRSEGLVDFINNCTKDFSEHIHSSKNKHWNNLTDKQRQAINSLASDESITIKPADKGSGIVIMNTNDYNETPYKIKNSMRQYPMTQIQYIVKPLTKLSTNLKLTAISAKQKKSG